MARLKSIDIAGWKSIRKTETPIELGPLNVLIGANGAGKSNLFSFLRLLHELANQRLQNYVGRSGGADTLLHYGSKTTTSIQARCSFELDDFEVELNLSLTHSAPDSLLIADDRWIYPNSETPHGNTIIFNAGALRESALTAENELGDPNAKVIRRFLSAFRVYHLDDTSSSAKIRLTNSLEDDLHLYGDGGNLAVMLYIYKIQHPMIYARIVETIRAILPGFDDFVLEPERLNPRKILLRWRRKERDYVLGPHQISDGLLRAMVLVTLFLQPEEDQPELIIVDEPELGLHPLAVEIIAGLARAASVARQVILATQSTTFLDHFEADETIVVNSSNGESQYQRLHPEEFKDWLEGYSLSELWEKNVIGGGPFR